MGLVLVMNKASTCSAQLWTLLISGVEHSRGYCRFPRKRHFSSPVFLGDVASAKDKELLLMVSFKKKWDLVSSTSKNCRAKSWFSVNHVTLLLFYVSVGSMDKNLFI